MKEYRRICCDRGVALLLGAKSGDSFVQASHPCSAAGGDSSSGGTAGGRAKAEEATLSSALLDATALGQQAFWPV